MQRAGYQGRLLAFVDGLDDPRTRYLTQLPKVECVVRPSAQGLLEDILRKAAVSRAAVHPARALPQLSSAVATASSATHPDARHLLRRQGGVRRRERLHPRRERHRQGADRAGIHYASPRRDRPLITLDCTTIPDGLMESHLFGTSRAPSPGGRSTAKGLRAGSHRDVVHRRAGRAEPALQAQAPARDPDA